MSHQVITKSLIVVLLIVIHPNFSKSDGVLLDDIGSCSPGIGAPMSEDVSHVRTQNLLQSSPAHPHLVRVSSNKCVTVTMYKNAWVISTTYICK